MPTREPTWRAGRWRTTGAVYGSVSALTLADASAARRRANETASTPASCRQLDASPIPAGLGSSRVLGAQRRIDPGALLPGVNALQPRTGRRVPPGIHRCGVDLGGMRSRGSRSPGGQEVFRKKTMDWRADRRGRNRSDPVRSGQLRTVVVRSGQKWT